jgi:MoaA/NifB/PqqE/SkfB family radical SAM enzyme
MSGSLTTVTASVTTPSATLSPHYIHSLPVLVLFPHNRCNCRCVMCDIWQIRQVREIRPDDLKPHVDSFRRLGVRWVVFSGGEPQMHSDLAGLSRQLRAEGIRLTLLTAGLLLEAQAATVADMVDDVIVSLDGPSEVHDQIRRVPRAFDRLRRGIEALQRVRPGMMIRARSTVQKANCTRLRDTTTTARLLGLTSVSFLAVDVTSEAFNRPGGWSPERQDAVALGPEDVGLLEREVELLIEAHSDDIAAGFVVESPEKLRHIVLHFRARLGQALPVAPHCNAPWVSAVVEADGTVRPCFFHRPLGNLHQGTLMEILNGESAVDFRRRLEVAKDPVCRRCVCSLYLSTEEQHPFQTSGH